MLWKQGGCTQGPPPERKAVASGSCVAIIIEHSKAAALKRRMAGLDDLPDPLLLIVVDRLGPRDLLAAGSASKRLRGLCRGKPRHGVCVHASQMACTILQQRPLHSCSLSLSKPHGHSGTHPMQAALRGPVSRHGKPNAASCAVCSQERGGSLCSLQPASSSSKGSAQQ